MFSQLIWVFKRNVSFGSMKIRENNVTDGIYTSEALPEGWLI